MYPLHSNLVVRRLRHAPAKGSNTDSANIVPPVRALYARIVVSVYPFAEDADGRYCRNIIDSGAAGLMYR